MNQKQLVPIACELPQDEQERCVAAYKSGLFSHVEEVRERAEGYSLRFSWDPQRIRELGEFLARETSCCAFLDHRIEVPPGKQVVWLHIDGPDEARGALKNELEQLVPSDLAFRAEKTASTTRTTWRRWSGAGLSGVGLAALVCCLAPVFGLSAIFAGSAWFVDPLLAMSLTLGVGLLAWTYSRRRSRSGSCC